MAFPLTNGIISLPTETVSDIFRFAVAGVTPGFWRPIPALSTAPSLQTELERVANAPLLVLSQVCSQWHEIAINNPTFWSDVEINGVLGHTPGVLEKAIGLLSARLKRSRDAPISVSLTCEDDGKPPHTRIFHLLAQHSHRWETAWVACSLEGLDTSVLNGRLPRLKDFQLKLPFATKLETVNFFGITPRLVNLSISAPLLRSESLAVILRRRQLRSFGCVVMFRPEFQEVISMLPRLPVTTNEFDLTMDLNHRVFQPHWSLPLHLPSITASISTLTLSSAFEFHPHQLSEVLDQVLASLTLPKLLQMRVKCGVYPKCVWEWPHTQFLALCERSGLGRCLKTLGIAEVRTAEGDLLEILSVLEALEHLAVGDDPRDLGEGESLLLTNSFLRAMTWVPARDGLAPRLSYFDCTSRLRFTHGLVVDFVESRLGRSADALFHLRFHSLLQSDAHLDSVVHTKLCDLAAHNKHFMYI
ncbi:hypothetical protein C8F04DRAFT_1406828 [Mycena alexandri]|uniref:F-box domain-containing protein n=1 Tax=Mycena alexandri TaxID=1745969 RepID=A0AAD6RXX4_9AGAR|nr:hypothetical protein C8F04DRAFT_1406828 [Mycena alexandri]